MTIFTNRVSRVAFAAGLLLATGGASAAVPVARGIVGVPTKSERPSKEDFMRSLAMGALGLKQDMIQLHELKNMPKAAENPNAETLVEMDFSGFTDGSIEELGTHITEAYVAEGNPMIDPSYMNGQEGWWGVGVYSAGGAAALAHPNYGGCIATPMMNLYGNLHVSCKVKVREGNASSVILFITPGCNNIWFPLNPTPDHMFYIVLNAEDFDKDWMDVNVDIPCTYIYDDAFIQFNSACYSTTGIVIDDVKITRDFDFVGVPGVSRFKDFTDNGFTAEWNPGTENKEYLVNLIGERCLSTEPVEFTEDFEDSESVKLDIQDYEIIGGEGKNGSSALSLNGDRIVTIPSNGGDITKLSVFIKPGVVSEDSSGFIGLAALYDGEWNSLGWNMYFDEIEPEGQTITLEMGESFKQLGFYMRGEEGESVIIDNLAWTTDGAYENEGIAKELRVADTCITFSDLEDELTYYFQVAGVNGDKVSAFTSLTRVDGIVAPELLPATSVNKENASYVANWSSVKDADSYTVKNYYVTTLSEAEECEVFYDSFDNCESDNGDNVYIDSSSYDGYADNDGWEMLDTSIFSSPYMNDGRIGGTLIKSPEISLQNNNGEFTLRFTAYSYNNVHIIVQSGYDVRYEYVEAEYDPMMGMSNEGYADIEMTFTNGIPNRELLFYTYENYDFMISEVSIVQKTKKGDKIYNLYSTATVDGNTTELTFDNLPLQSCQEYAYMVMANRKYNDGVSVSSESDSIMCVEFENTSVAEVTVEARVVTRNGDIVVTLPQASEITVVNAAGAVVAKIMGNHGSNVISDLAKGVYVVKVGEKTCKVVL